jgi:hypothetical protein
MAFQQLWSLTRGFDVFTARTQGCQFMPLDLVNPRRSAFELISLAEKTFWKFEVETTLKLLH